MNEPPLFDDPEEAYLFNERLGMMEVIGRNPAPEELQIAFDDVLTYRRQLEE